jgi:hypothetical protein
MATTSLIQFTAAGSAADTMNRRQVETFSAKEAITAGDWVAFDYAAVADGDVTLGIYKADGNSSPVRTPMGVALESVATGQLVRVCISGVCDALVGDNAGGGNAIGTLLQITNTAGQVDLASAGSAQPVCGVLAEVIAPAAGATIKRVVVRKSF